MQPAALQRPIQIVHLEDSIQDHELAQHALQKSGLAFSMVRVDTPEEFLKQIESFDFDVILADYRLPGFTAIDIWESLPEQARRAPFILLSGAIGESAAVAAIKLGISDYLLKDDMGKLAHVIRRAIEVQEARNAKIQADVELAASEKRLADFAEHLQTAIELERAAIAREIHDDIGGSLAAIKFDLSWLGRHTEDAATLTHITSATEMLQHALGASQRIMMNLRPAILDQGLEAAAQWLASSFEKRTGIKTVFRATLTQLDIPKNVQLTAYRTAQEALTNISKHAQCTQVSLELSDAEGVLTLEVSDNGRGIAKSEFSKDHAFGIKGLHERAKTVGGWLDVSTRSGHGTSIILSIPLNSSASRKQQDDFQ